MPGAVEHRSVTPFIKKLRDLMRGRECIMALRFRDELSTRDPPPPDVPGGPYHKTSKIYYFQRDARREVIPAQDITTLKQIADKPSEAAAKVKSITPGKVYLYDDFEVSQQLK